MKVLFVINPKSGKREGVNFEAAISEKSRQQGFEFLIYRLHKENTDKDILQEIEEYQPDIVAGAGGDGTVNFLSKLLLNKPIPLLIIPLGSANGMAKELGISNADFALNLITKGVKREIDLLNINKKLCIHLADVGLNARVVKRFENDKRRGIITYARHLFNEIFLIKKYRFYITINDEKELIRKAISLTFANASKYGTGAVINPTGKVDDGCFELVIIKPFPRIKLLSIAWKMFTGSLNTSEYAEVISCKKATIRTSKSTTLQIDGEVIGKLKEIEVEILPKALLMITPESA